MSVKGTPKRNLLLIVLPYLVDSSTNTKKKSVRSFLAFPYGVLTIASYIQKHSNGSHGVKILDLNTPSDISEQERLNKEITDGNYDIVGFSMSYDISFQWLKKLSAYIRQTFPSLLQVAGGPAVTTGYNDIIEEDVCLDALCFSEGEKGLLNLLNEQDFQIGLKTSPWIRNTKEGLPHLPPKAVTEDLDLVIDVDYELVDVNAYSMKEAFSPFVRYAEGAKQFFLVTSRGCPFKCNFCAEPQFHGANMRYASVDLIINHVAKLVKKYNLNVLTIYDDQLLLNKVRAKELFRRLAEFNIRIEMPNGVTLSYIDEELAFLMKEAGVDTIFLAIESGSERVLREIILKPIAFEKIKPTVQLLQKTGIFTCAFFVLGLPGETDEEREETRRFILDTEFDWVFFNYATPLRGSRLFDQCKENGWLDKEHQRIGSVDMTDYVIKSPGIDKETLKQTVFDLNLEANFVNNRNMREKNWELAVITFNEVINRHEEQPFAHYYLSKAYNQVTAFQNKKKADYHYERYLQIISNDPEWRKHAQRWKLQFSI